MIEATVLVTDPNVPVTTTAKLVRSVGCKLATVSVLVLAPEMTEPSPSEAAGAMKAPLVAVRYHWKLGAVAATVTENCTVPSTNPITLDGSTRMAGSPVTDNEATALVALIEVRLE